MVLIATALGTLSLQIAKAIKGERFERGVDQLITKLTLAQELMLDFHSDLCLELKQEEKGITCHFDIDCKLPPHLEKSINRYAKIEGIEQLMFNGMVKERILLCYDATLGATAQGILTLFAQERQEHIVLKGYPSYLKRGKIEIIECHEEYPEEILSAI
jgi:hypothetical protein